MEIANYFSVLRDLVVRRKNSQLPREKDDEKNNCCNPDVVSGDLIHISG